MSEGGDPSCPPPDMWLTRRKCLLVTFEDVGVDDTYEEIPFHEVEEGDVFLLEANRTYGGWDPLVDQPECERIYEALSDPYPIDGVLQIDCKRL